MTMDMTRVDAQLLDGTIHMRHVCLLHLAYIVARQFD